MADPMTRLFDAYDRGRLSRRQLLQALGIGIAMRPLSLLAHGQDPAQTGPPPFRVRPDNARLDLRRTRRRPRCSLAATGWKTVLLDSISAQAADLPEGGRRSTRP